MPTAEPSELIYEDKYCQIYHDRLVIKGYYFPIAGSKTVNFTQIESIHTNGELGLSSFEMKGWGMGFSTIWCACDTGRFGVELTGLRAGMELVVVKVKDDWCRKGFTAEVGSNTLAVLRDRVPSAFAASTAELINLTAKKGQ
ncbi:hypothetical protein HDU93_000892 [Gonapodya sp. JEL0774]|nr:hypothetical protein HDU93_000892 [Gonapodya sp. JEL0774]